MLCNLLQEHNIRSQYRTNLLWVSNFKDITPAPSLQKCFLNCQPFSVEATKFICKILPKNSKNAFSGILAELRQIFCNTEIAPFLPENLMHVTSIHLKTYMEGWKQA